MWGPVAHNPCCKLSTLKVAFTHRKIQGLRHLTSGLGRRVKRGIPGVGLDGCRGLHHGTLDRAAHALRDVDERKARLAGLLVKNG